MTDDLSDLVRDVATSCRATQTRMQARSLTRSYDAALSKHGIRSTEFALLIAIAHLNGPRMNELAKFLDLDPSTLTRNMGVLTRKNLASVNREGHRTRTALLTTVGETLIKEAYPSWQKAQRAS